MSADGMTPTDPIRDEAVKVLAEALHLMEFSTVPWKKCQVKKDHREDAAAMLDASPTLARRLALGTAWDAAVATDSAGLTSAIAKEYIHIKGAHKGPWETEELDGIPCEWCVMAAEQTVKALAALSAKLGEREVSAPWVVRRLRLSRLAVRTVNGKPPVFTGIVFGRFAIGIVHVGSGK